MTRRAPVTRKEGATEKERSSRHADYMYPSTLVLGTRQRAARWKMLIGGCFRDVGDGVLPPKGKPQMHLRLRHSYPF